MLFGKIFYMIHRTISVRFLRDTIRKKDWQKTYKKKEILEERENKLHTLGNLLEDIGVY